MFQNLLLPRLRYILTQSRLPEIHFIQDRVDTMKLCRTAEYDSSKFAHRLERNSTWISLSRDLTRIFGEEGKENGRKSR